MRKLRVQSCETICYGLKVQIIMANGTTKTSKSYCINVECVKEIYKIYIIKSIDDKINIYVFTFGS